MLKKLCFFFILILWTNNSIAQNTALDSLSDLVYSYSKEDSTKVRLLFEYHNFYVQNSNYDSMLVLQTRANDLANMLGGAESLARANIMNGKYFYKKHLYQNAINSFSIASTFLKETDNNELKYDLHTYLGVIYFKTGYLDKELDSCIIHYKKALFFSRSLPADNQVKAITRLSQAFSYVPLQDSVFFYITLNPQINFRSIKFLSNIIF